MSIRAPLDPFGSSTLLVDRMVGKAYPTVRHVSEHMEYVKHISAHMAELYRIHGSITELDTLGQNIALLEALLEKLGPIIEVSEHLEAIENVAVHLSNVLAVSGSLDDLVNISNNLEDIILALGEAEAVSAHAIQANVFPTRAELLIRSLPAVQTRVRTSGYSTSGDGGDASYIAVNSEPLHPGKFQTPDGRWWEIADSVVTPEMFGALGDGTANDTAALQAALDWTYWSTSYPMHHGKAVRLTDAKVYLVDNIAVPHSTYDLRTVRIYAEASSTIKKRSSADNSYLIATQLWLENSDNSGTSFKWENIIFDGAGIAGSGFVLKAGLTTFVDCQANNCSIGWLLTRRNRDGSLGAHTHAQSNNEWHRCRAKGNTYAALINQGIEGVHDSASTDGMLFNCQFDGTGGVATVDLESIGGWFIAMNHLFSWDLVPDLIIRSLGRGARIIDNIIEGPVEIHQSGYAYPQVVGPGNDFWSDVTVLFRDDTGFEKVIVQGNTFSEDINGVEARLIHGRNRATKILVSANNVFTNLAPHGRVPGNTLGKIMVLGMEHAETLGLPPMHSDETGGILNVNAFLDINNGARFDTSRIGNFLDDAAAAVGTVPLGGLYRTGNILKVRLT